MSGEPTLGETERVEVGHTGQCVHGGAEVRSGATGRGGGLSGELRVSAGMFFFLINVIYMLMTLTMPFTLHTFCPSPLFVDGKIPIA